MPYLGKEYMYAVMQISLWLYFTIFPTSTQLYKTAKINLGKEKSCKNDRRRFHSLFPLLGKRRSIY